MNLFAVVSGFFIGANWCLKFVNLISLGFCQLLIPTFLTIGDKLHHVTTAETLLTRILIWSKPIRKWKKKHVTAKVIRIIKILRSKFDIVTSLITSKNIACYYTSCKVGEGVYHYMYVQVCSSPYVITLAWHCMLNINIVSSVEHVN